MKKEEREMRQTADVTLAEANQRLKKALDSKDLHGAAVAQSLLDGAEKRRQDANRKSNELSKLQSSIDRRREKLSSNILPKKPRT